MIILRHGTDDVRYFSQEALIGFLKETYLVQDDWANEYRNKQMFLDGPALFTVQVAVDKDIMLEQVLVGYAETSDQRRFYYLIVLDLIRMPLGWEATISVKERFHLFLTGPYYRDTVEELSKIAKNDGGRLIALGPLIDLIDYLPLSVEECDELRIKPYQ